MGRYRCWQTLLNVACYLSVVSVSGFCPLVFGGLFKLIAFLVFACLLMFVVVRSADLRRVVAACLQMLPISLFALFVGRRRIERSPTARLVPNEPSLSPFFQRPPPIFSV